MRMQREPLAEFKIKFVFLIGLLDLIVEIVGFSESAYSISYIYTMMMILAS
jgi:hypothetical protein